MRIGIDLLAIQSPFSRGRGIGRYSRSLLKTLLTIDFLNEYVLYSYEDLPIDEVPTSSKTQFRQIARVPEAEEHTLGHVADRLARTNPDGLDWLLLMSPFETWQFYSLPARPLNGLKMAAVVYDMIPFLFQEIYLSAPDVGSWFYGHLRRLRTYDRLLAISEATQADVLRLLRLSEDRVVTIGTASDGRFFVSEPDGLNSESSTALLNRWGINRPFVFCLGSGDARKNLVGLMDAFARLPENVRDRHQLVIACAFTGEEADRVRQHATAFGIAERVILTGKVSDADLKVFYQRCATFAFPSLYEGFGLPILEAMHCGAAVLAGDNSSQPEVVGDAGMLCNASDPTDIAAKLASLLTNPKLVKGLGLRARLHADQFRWEEVAQRTLSAMTSFPVSKTHRKRSFRVDLPRPRLAMFSPYPPKRSGISDYTTRLLEPLKKQYSIDLYHDAGYLPDLGCSSWEFGCHDYRLFDRHSQNLGYRGVIYHVGNSRYHEYIYDTLRKHPGIVVLHDFCLAGLHAGLAQKRGIEHFRDEVEDSHPGRSVEFLDRLSDWTQESGGLQEAMARRGLFVNRRVLEAAEQVIVHSEWCRRRVEEIDPRLSKKVLVIPMGAEPRRIDPSKRATVRQRFGIAQDTIVFANFGILHPIKLNVETIQAFAMLADQIPEALLIFVGRDLGEGEAEREALALGLKKRVRFLGYQPDSDYKNLIAATDIGLGLRRPPTNGETSASLLDLLRAGVPTIATNTGTFAELPDSIVEKVNWDQDKSANSIVELADVMRQLATDSSRRERLGQEALRYVEVNHDWSRVVEKYTEMIEQAYFRRQANCRSESNVPAPQVSKGWSRLSPNPTLGG